MDYGATSAYGSSSPLVSTLVTSHSVSLSGLQASKLYHYRVKSRDAAGNLATSNDFTFTTDGSSTPPTISRVSAGSITATGATVRWTTDKASDSQVDYGTTTRYGSSTPRLATMVTNHSVSLSGLRSSQLYHYRVRSRDSTGNTATSGDFTFTTSRDGTPPAISGVAADSITASAATIRWTTDEASDTQVEYGLTTRYGSSTALNTARVTTHTQVLRGLDEGKLYHYRVKSRDAAGNLAVSRDFRFNTESADADAALVISRMGASWITATVAVINWTTDKPSDGQVEFGTNTDYDGSGARVSALSTSHTANLSDLKRSTRYHYRVKSRDAKGYLATSGDKTFTTSAPDKTPPRISSVAVSSITGRQATISWTTNEASNSQVKYGLTSAYGNNSNLNAGLMLKHSQVLHGLSAGNTYHYRVKSRDASGNLATSADFTFRTASSGIRPPTIVTFDGPAPQGRSNDLLNGVLEGINFGSGQWRWEGSYGVNATRHVYFDSSRGNSRTITFSPAPQVLNSLTVFSLSSGSVTLSDNLGQRKSLSVPVGSIQVVATGWRKRSTTITVNFSGGWNFGLDDIAYSEVATSLSDSPADDSDSAISSIAPTTVDIVGQPATPPRRPCLSHQLWKTANSERTLESATCLVPSPVSSFPC